MRVTNVSKGRTLKTVSIEAPETADRETLVETAISAANETRESLQGWSVSYWPLSESWTVDLHTD